MLEAKYVIIGNSAGGIGAIEAIREVDREGSIILISDEPYPAYSRPLISEHLAGERDLDGMLYRPEDFYEWNGVQTLFGKVATDLNVSEKTVKLEDRQRVAYGKLLLAVGGKPIVPPMEGLDRKGVFTFTTLDDAREIRALIPEVKKAVVIGGGLIGISVTDALRKLGVEVSIIELMNRILGAVLDEEASRMAGEVVRKAGVDIRTGRTVKTITGKAGKDGQVGGVILDNGERIESDLVIVAIGVSPRIDLVKGTDINVNRGILVDRHMATSAPDVYACGDVAESYDFIVGADRVVPIWPNAHIGGRVAGYNMAGKNAEYPGGTAMNSLKYFGLPVASAGLVNAGDGCEVLSHRTDGRYQKFVLQNGKLVGMVLVKDVEPAGILFGLMRDRVDVSGFRDSLVSDAFGLISLPEDILRKRLELPDLGRLHVFHEPEAYADAVDEG
ncbi:MAG: NAD(P)/FAD-dependent oxidoreductase [Chloroflexi bacterium]|nr:NAD(P)/FAD-dependent oxidoreductase [Chloroflexota bacterium]